MGRLLKVTYTDTLTYPQFATLYEITYNELGQIKEKKVYKEDLSKDFLQDIDFEYTIRGQIKSINDIDSLGSDLFAMNFIYDEPDGNIIHNLYKNGNISAIQWVSKNDPDQIETYSYTYDQANRLTQATYTPDNHYDVTVEYDLNGNITHLTRKGQVIKTIAPDRRNPKPKKAIQYKPIDNLHYTYNGNQLTSVNDAVQNIVTPLNNDFRDGGSERDIEYNYDANGNMTYDANKNITVSYNYLDLPETITEQNKKYSIEYMYSAEGTLLRTKEYEEGKLIKTTDYCGQFVYEDRKLAYIMQDGMRILFNYNDKNATPIPQQGDKGYEVTKEFYITDHLGNVRVVFNENAEIVQENSYYPYGLLMKQSGIISPGIDNQDVSSNKYLYNGKEIQPFTGYYAYGFRQYDAQIGRWHSIDKMAELDFSSSGYAYVDGNPVIFYDILGLAPGKPSNNFDDYYDWEADVERALAEYAAWAAQSGAGRGVDISGGSGGTFFADHTYGRHGGGGGVNNPNPIYDKNGNFLGTDDLGLQGEAIIMNKEDFRQNMPHEEAMEKGKTLDNMSWHEAYKFANNGNFLSFLKHYNNLNTRPDWDGYLTLAEANEWYRNGNRQPLYVDLSKIDLSNIYSLGENYVGQEKVMNLLIGSASWNDGLVYGSVKLKRYPNHAVRAYADTYDFDMHSWWNPLNWPRNLSTIFGSWYAGEGRPYTIYFYGSKQLKPILPWIK